MDFHSRLSNGGKYDTRYSNKANPDAEKKRMKNNALNSTSIVHQPRLKTDQRPVIRDVRPVNPQR